MGRNFDTVNAVSTQMQPKVMLSPFVFLQSSQRGFVHRDYKESQE